MKTVFGWLPFFTVVLMWIQPALANEDEWNYQIHELNVTVTLPCETEKQPRLSESFIEGWMFPDLTHVNITYNDGNRIVQDGGENLTIISVQQSDLGYYHCMTVYLTNDTLEENWYLIKVGLNAKGPYFEDLWAKYDRNVYIGLTAMFSFLLASLYVWIVYKFRWIPDDSEGRIGPAHEYADVAMSFQNGVYLNTAFDSQENNYQEPRKETIKQNSSPITEKEKQDVETARI